MIAVMFEVTPYLAARGTYLDLAATLRLRLTGSHLD